MKRILSVLMVVSMLLFCASAYADLAKYGNSGLAKTSVENVNIREQPRQRSERVVQIKTIGTELTILGEEYDDDGALWYYIRTPKGKEGYIRGDLIEIIKPGEVSNTDSNAVPASTDSTTAVKDTASTGINWHNETFTYTDNDGYTFRVTLKYTPWNRLSTNKSMIDEAWRQLGQTTEVPGMSDWGFTKYSDDTYIYGPSATPGFKQQMNDMQYIVGTFEIENITDGWHFSSDNPRTVVITSSFPYRAVVPGAGITQEKQVMTIQKVCYSSEPEVHCAWLTFSPKMTSDHWGPVGFIVAGADYYTPKNPEGTAKEYTEKAQFMIKNCKFDVGRQPDM